MIKGIPLFAGFFLLISITLLAWCSQKSLSKDQLFEKKQECESYKDEIQKEQGIWLMLSEVFYSPKLNTCLYVLKWNWRNFIIDRFWDESKSIYETNDYSTCKNVLKNDEKKCLDNEKIFDAKIKELKGE